MSRLPQSEIVAGLSDIVGERHVSCTVPDLVSYAGDFWPKQQIWKLGGDVERYTPDCVVWPADEEETARVVRFCGEHRVPIVPYGAGSGVCGGTLPIHGGVVVDVKRMRGVNAIDRESLTVDAQAGINGQHLEDALDHAGFTLGHFPSSIMCSTLGGWLAARSAGQFSSRYGKIEDMVMSLRAVLPDGSVLDTADRAAGEPDWTQLLVGSEGTLGIITSATLRVSPRPASRVLRGFKFLHLHDALRAMRLVMQAGLRPMVLRLYDPFDSLMALGKEPKPEHDEGGRLAAVGELVRTWRERLGVPASDDPVHRRVLAALHRKSIASALAMPAIVNRMAHMVPSPCLLIIGFEGADEAVQRESWRARQILVEAGGSDAGAHVGEAWLVKRYAVSFKQAKLYQAGAFVDTMEVATTWDRLEALYEGVRSAVEPHAFIMAHFSHAYREGCSIYFTFAGYRRQADRAEALYDRIWSAALDAVHRAGGTASHHHGVGLSKKNAMVTEHGEMLRVWRALKDALDPDGIMNPGKLFPDGAGAA